MLEVLAFSYGLLTSFILAGVERNHRERRPQSRVLTYAGYVLCGSLGTVAVLSVAYIALWMAGLL